MREILFRGKRIDSELWVEGSLVNNIFFRAGTNRPVPYIINPDEYEEYCCMEDIGELAVEVIEDTVGQFTGLVDRNGKRIFEGDIVKYAEGYHHWSGEYNKATVVEFVGGSFYPFCGCGGEYSMSTDYAIVIGNIYDNSDLMKEIIK